MGIRVTTISFSLISSSPTDNVLCRRNWWQHQQQCTRSCQILARLLYYWHQLHQSRFPGQDHWTVCVGWQGARKATPEMDLLCYRGGYCRHWPCTPAFQEPQLGIGTFYMHILLKSITLILSNVRLKSNRRTFPWQRSKRSLMTKSATCSTVSGLALFVVSLSKSMNAKIRRPSLWALDRISVCCTDAYM